MNNGEMPGFVQREQRLERRVKAEEAVEVERRSSPEDGAGIAIVGLRSKYAFSAKGITMFRPSAAPR